LLEVFRRSSGVMMVTGFYNALPDNVLIFLGVWTNQANRSVTETAVDITCVTGGTIIDLRVTVTTNGKDGITDLIFRDDAASTVILPIAAGLTGEFAITDLSVAIIAGSLITFAIDGTASTVGTITLYPVVMTVRTN